MENCKQYFFCKYIQKRTKKKVYGLHILIALITCITITNHLYAFDENDYEPDNSFYSANMLDHGQNRTLMDKDEDWFMFYAAQESDYSLIINNDSDINITFTIYNSKISNIFHSTTSDSSTIFPMTFPDADLYYISLKPSQELSGNKIILYNIKVQNSRQYDAYEPDNSQNDATPIVIDDNKPQYRNFHDTDDVDWVIFYGIKDEIYSIETTNQSSSCSYTVEIVNTGLKDSIKPSETETIPFPCDSQQIYYLKIIPSNICEHSYYSIFITLDAAIELKSVDGRILNACSKFPVEKVNLSLSDGYYTGSGVSRSSGIYSIDNINKRFDCEIHVSKNHYVDYSFTIPDLKKYMEDGVDRDLYIYPEPDISEVIQILKKLSGQRTDDTFLYKLSYVICLMQTMAGLRQCSPE
jgi:hypothetical protein